MIFTREDNLRCSLYPCKPNSYTRAGTHTHTHAHTRARGSYPPDVPFLPNNCPTPSLSNVPRSVLVSVSSHRDTIHTSTGTQLDMVDSHNRSISSYKQWDSASTRHTWCEIPSRHTRTQRDTPTWSLIRPTWANEPTSLSNVDRGPVDVCRGLGVKSVLHGSMPRPAGGRWWNFSLFVGRSIASLFVRCHGDVF